MGLFDLFGSKNSSKSVEEQIHEIIEKNVQATIRKQGGNIMGGYLVIATIMDTENALKNDRSLFLSSGLTKVEYENLVHEISQQMFEKYIER